MCIDFKIKPTKSDTQFKYTPHTLRSTLYLYTPVYIPQGQ